MRASPILGGVPFTIDYDDEDAQKHIRRVAALLIDLRPFWPKVVPIFIGWMRAQFETEGEFAGNHWAPLSPAYAAYKAIRFPGKGILIAHGDLRKAASNPRRNASRQSLTLTIVDPKIQYHQEGTDRMPARPLLFGDPLPLVAAAQLDTAASEFIDDWLRRIP